MNNATTTKFETGKTFTGRASNDHNCVWSFTVTSRTEKTVTVECDGDSFRRGVFVDGGTEKFFPFGRHSQSVVVSADKVDD